MTFQPVPARKLQKSAWLLPLLGLLLVTVMSVLVGVTYSAQRGREQEIKHRLINEVYSSANTVSYFFYERSNDLSVAAGNEQVRAYFENVKLGMSDEYGLLISRMAIGEYFSSILEDRRIAGKPIYRSLVLFDSEGKILVAKPEEGEDGPSIAREHFQEYTYAHAAQGVHVETRHGTPHLLLSRRVMLDGKEMGFLFAEIPMKGIISLLVRGVDVNGWPVILAMGRTVLATSSQERAPIPLDKLDLSASGEHSGTLDLPAGFFDPDSPAMLLCWRQVPDTPFQLISPVESRQLLGPVSPLGILAILSAMCLAVLGSVFTVWRSGTKQLILGARLEEKITSEVAIRRKAHELEVLLDSLPGYAFFKDRGGHYITGNARFCGLVGLTPETLVGKTDHEVFPADLADDFVANEARIFSGETETIEIEEAVADHGQVLDLLTRKVALRDEGGEVLGLIGLGFDITDKKRVEQELKAANDEMELRVNKRTSQLYQSNELLVAEINERKHAHREVTQLLSAISAVLVGIDKADRVVKWNVAAERAFGLTAAQALGQPLADLPLSWERDMVRQDMDRCWSTGQSVKVNNISYRRDDGKEGFFFIEMNPILDENGELEGLLLLGTDITDFKLLEAQLAQAQKLESIGQLAAGIAHEINTPTQYVGDTLVFLKEASADLLRVLDAVRGLTPAAEDPARLAPELEKIQAALAEADFEFLREEMPRSFQRVQDGVARVGTIVRAMRNFSHHGGGEKRAVDLNKAVQDTVIVSRNEWKYVATLETDTDPALPLVSCLPGEMNQVLLNLVVNAAHAVADAPHRPGELGAIRISTRLDGDFVVISVADTGIGIPAAIQGKIFDPFFTTKAVGRGTGQGLTVVYDVVVNKHGGTISFETTEGRGTTFHVRIPVSG